MSQYLRPLCQSARLIHIVLTTLWLMAGLIAVWQSSANARSFETIKKSGELVIAVLPGAAPYSYEDHQDLSGIDIDLGKKLAEALGLKPSFVVREPAKQTEADIIFSETDPTEHPVLSASGETAQLHLPYGVERLALLTAKAKASKPNEKSEQEQASKYLGIIKGSIAERHLRTGQEEGQVNGHKIKQFRNFAEALEAFRSQKVGQLLVSTSQAVIAGRSATQPVTIRNPADFKVAPTRWQRVIKLKDQTLLSKSRTTLRSLIESQMLQRIYEAHGLPGKLAASRP